MTEPSDPDPMGTDPTGTDPAQPLGSVRFNAGVATDTGRVRSANQDASLVLPARRLYVVADGMGGHQGGEVASALATETLAAATIEPAVESLIAAVDQANEAINARGADDPDLRGMGTTLCAIAVVEDEDGAEEVAWANVGDSRVYLYRDDDLIQLSTDHSLVEDLRRDGQITDEEAAVHPRRNIVTRALGIDTRVEVDVRTVIPFLGDRFLLSSDGMFNELSTDQIAATLRRLADPTEAAADLVRQANEHGGRDNITCLVADVTDDGGRAAAASAAIAAAKAAGEPDQGPESVADEPVTQDVPPEGPTDDLAGFRSRLPAAPSDGADLPFGRGGSNNDDFFGDMDKARGRHVTWRVLAFLVALLLVLGVAAGGVAWYAKRTYFLGFESSEVVIYQGQPGGLLWFDPQVADRTGLQRADLTGAEIQRVENELTYASLSDALAAATNLEVDVREREERATTTTTTTTTTSTTAPTTTRPTTTTTQPPAPTSTP